MLVRPPAVAGFFYPGDPVTLRDTVDTLLASAEPGPCPKAIVVPHAGYIYSGSTAALAYALLTGVTTVQQVVVLGPTHRVGVRALALPGVDAMATPLGEVALWTEGVSRVVARPDVVTSSEVHAEEHSLEVQLPFLQRVLPGVPVLPLAVGWVTPEQVAEVLEVVWGGPETLIVISSDLSHYHPSAEARRIDHVTIEQILTLAGPLDHEQACGATGIDGLLLAARRHELRPRLLGACNSGDTAGDRRRVVGYTAVAFDEAGGGS